LVPDRSVIGHTTRGCSRLPLPWLVELMKHQDTPKHDQNKRPYRVPSPRRLGARPGVNLDKALQLAGELEDAETIRKLRRDKGK
jgi:hypothetical protein